MYDQEKVKLFNHLKKKTMKISMPMKLGQEFYPDNAKKRFLKK